MFQVPNFVSNVTDNILGVNKSKKIKGKVVLMRKNVLDFNNLASSAVDSVTEFLGQGVSVQLVSASKADPGLFLISLLPFFYYHRTLFLSMKFCCVNILDSTNVENVVLLIFSISILNVG